MTLAKFQGNRLIKIAEEIAENHAIMVIIFNLTEGNGLHRLQYETT